MQCALRRSTGEGDPVPSFADGKDADAWYDRRVAAAGKEFARRTHLYYTLLGWDDIARVLLPHLRAIGSPRGADAAYGGVTPDAHIASILDTAPVYRHLRVNPDAALNTLQYLYHHNRCGIFVAVRQGRVAAFFPFVNVAYTNKWSHRVTFGRTRTLKEFVAEKAATLRKAPEDLLPIEQWWMNGGIVCNVMPETYWGDAFLAALRSMLDATCAAHPVPDVDFFLNKRDYPQLKRDGSEPYARFVGPTDAKSPYSTFAPVFSFYTGSSVADLPMPCTEDWVVATQRAFPGGPTSVPRLGSLPPFMRRAPMAVFRGSSTGEGLTAEDNVRLRIVHVAAGRPDLIDAGITTHNTSRDKVVGLTPRGHICIDYRRPQPTDARASFMPMHVQAAKFRYMVYADGHCAASRYGTLMHTGCVILRVASTQMDDCGHLWLFSTLVGAVVNAESAHVPGDADHMLVHADLSNLFATIEFLNANPETAASIARAAAKKAPTVDSITAYWATALWQVHARTCVADAAPDGKQWFAHVDPQYATLPV